MAIPVRCFEDFVIGDTLELGRKTVSRDEIIAYAREFDPAEPYISGTCAAGWHIGAMFMRIFYDGLLANSTGRGSPGIEVLDWPTPLMAGDTLVVSAEIMDAKLSRSRPEIGLVWFRFLAHNQDGAVVMNGTSWTMFLRREAANALV